jgi:hypothetical protein
LDLGVVLATAIGLCIVTLGSYVISLRPVFGIPLVLSVTLMTAGGVSLQFGLGTISIYQQDVALTIIAFATVLRLLAGYRVNRLILLLLAILIVNYPLGVGRYGFQVATNGSREYFYFLVTAAFFSTVLVDRHLIQSLRDWWVAASGYLTVVAALFVAGVNLHKYEDRPLINIQAFIVLEAIIMLMIFPYKGNRVIRLGFPLAGCVVIVAAAQRTVWVSAAIAIVALTGPWNSSFGSRVTRRVRRLVPIGALTIALVLLVGPVTLSQTVSAGFSTFGADNGTLEWRGNGWRQLVVEQFSRPISQILIGNPSGTGYARTGLSGGVTEVNPHNMYVASLLVFGVIGLAIFLVLYFSAFRCLRRLNNSGFQVSARQLISALLSAQLVFFLGYGSYMTMGLVLGICLSSVSKWGSTRLLDRYPDVRFRADRSNRES